MAHNLHFLSCCLPWSATAAATKQARDSQQSQHTAKQSNQRCISIATGCKGPTSQVRVHKKRGVCRRSLSSETPAAHKASKRQPTQPAHKQASQERCISARPCVGGEKNKNKNMGQERRRANRDEAQGGNQKHETTTNKSTRLHHANTSVEEAGSRQARASRRRAPEPMRPATGGTIPH
jgi:hypothetical protein